MNDLILVVAIMFGIEGLAGSLFGIAGVFSPTRELQLKCLGSCIFVYILITLEAVYLILQHLLIK